MKRAAFVCRQCGSDLTEFLVEADEGALARGIGVAMVPAGRYVAVNRLWTYRDFMSNQYVGADAALLAFEPGDYLLNIQDVRHRMAADAAGGCCGYQPRDEANALCANGHAIGTVHSDVCWSALVFRLIDRAVEAVTLDEADPQRPVASAPEVNPGMER